MRTSDRTSPADFRRRILLFVLLGGVVLHGGCRLGRGGYALTGYDAVCTPGEPTPVRVRLSNSGLFGSVEGRVIRFYRHGSLHGQAKTNRAGMAWVPFSPQRAGDTRFEAECVALKQSPIRVDMLIRCRPADAPIAVVDIDRTLTAPGREPIGGSGAQAEASAVSVLTRLAGQYAVIYVTRRADHLAAGSTAWLRRHGYPPGPVLTPHAGQTPAAGAEGPSRLGEIRTRFRGRGIGISDRIADVQACTARGLEAFLLLPAPESDNPQELRRLADALEELHPAVQVVQNWRQIEQVLFAGAAHPRPAAQRRLRKEAQRRVPR